MSLDTNSFPISPEFPEGRLDIPLQRTNDSLPYGLGIHSDSLGDFSLDGEVMPLDFESSTPVGLRSQEVGQITVALNGIAYNVAERTDLSAAAESKLEDTNLFTGGFHDIYETSSSLPSDDDTLSVSVEATDEYINIDRELAPLTGTLRVRNAEKSQDELEKLVRLELNAFSDVYGDRITKANYDAVMAKYKHRLSTLPQWTKVIEDDGSKEIVGMIIGCPTNYDHDELSRHDMTTNQGMEEVYHPEGNHLYIINLATHPDAPKNLRFMLLGGIVAEGVRANVEKAYFESRLPGFNNWMSEHGIDMDDADAAIRDEFAELYWQKTMEVNGKQQPVDKLLRLYTQIGARPLSLIPEAWEVDGPSNAYGVLCEFDNPLPRRAANIKVVRNLAARALEAGMKNKKLMEKVFGKTK